MMLSKFKINGEPKKVKFIETLHVKDGVSCDVYEFIDDDSMDLGVITVAPGKSTPRQKVLLGDKTIEGYLSGSGFLKIEEEGSIKEYSFPNETGVTEVSVKIGSIMQWTAKDDGLIFYEICTPPYADGRYEDLPNAEV